MLNPGFGQGFFFGLNLPIFAKKKSWTFPPTISPH